MAALRTVSVSLIRQLARHAPRNTVRTPLRGLATAKAPSSLFAPLDTFSDRHIGPDDKEIAHMLEKLGYNSMDAFIADAVPEKIRSSVKAVSDESIPALSESELFRRAKELGKANQPYKSYIGMGYHNAVVPPVILRNVCYALTCFWLGRGTNRGRTRLWKALHGTPLTLLTSRRLRKVSLKPSLPQLHGDINVSIMQVVSSRWSTSRRW